MNELLAALGQAWPRVLLYPGGLFALAASWLLARWLYWCARQPFQTSGQLTPAALLDLVPPLAMLTLLPLAPAQSFPYGLDLVVALGLLEWPRLRAAIAPDVAFSRVTLVRNYGPLVLAACGMAEARGSLGLSDLLGLPAAPLTQALLLSSAVLWLAGLPQLIVTSEPAPQGTAGALTLTTPAERLRALGLLVIGTLPLLGAAVAWMTALPPDLAGWLIPPLVSLGAALLVGAQLWLPAQLRRVSVPALAIVVLALLVWEIASK